MERAPRPSLEDFRGDYGAVASMMRRSWAQNKETPLLYTEEFLRSAFDYPGTDRRLSPTLYDEAGPIAFVAGYPRRVLLDGRERRLILNTFLTAAPEVKGKGYGLALWAECTRRARGCGFDGTINFCVEGDEMNRYILGCSRALGFQTRRILTVPYLARLVPSPTDDEPGADVDVFLEAAACVAQGPGRLIRVWSREEAEWECSRYGAISVSHDCGPRRGVLAGYVMPVGDGERTKCVILENVLWGSLENTERAQLVEKFLRRAGAAGAGLAVVPQMGYADLDPLTKSGFRRSRRLVHAYLSLWNGAPTPEAVDSAYIDVF